MSSDRVTREECPQCGGGGTATWAARAGQPHELARFKHVNRPCDVTDLVVMEALGATRQLGRAS
ncbi:hypothetical protein [Smaragdicoccus niigatensis]|uniref:hypothetical protein n=1 Tax=Smaragdicoccus niigatensis TaxID=359359 RepID=UPI00039A29A8|nr:hypothetical protein [Smaragdicoccus niigatensis]